MEYVKYFLIYGILIVGMWGAGTMFASSVSDHKVFSPEPGIKCVVVSRMFNTSVDCWKDGQ